MNGYKLPDSKKVSIVKSKINQTVVDQKTQTTCNLCGKEIKKEEKGFHKSHTIPFFCLENIKGEYNKNYVLLKPEILGISTPFSDKESIGTNKASVFYSICSTCDQKFNVYESEDALLNKNPEELVDSLALKIYLNELFNSELRNFKNTIDYSNLTEEEIISNYYINMGKIEVPTTEIDVRDFRRDLEYAKTSFEKGYGNYKVLYHKILNYTVPVAAQTSIPISYNVDYTRLQNVNSLNNKTLEDLLLCVFPLKNKSVIILFYKTTDRLMKKYSKQFKKLTETEKLNEVFYLLIRYKSANYYFSPFAKDILMDENIRGVFSMEDTSIVLDGFNLNLSSFENQNWKRNLPKILSEEYSVQELKTNQ